MPPSILVFYSFFPKLSLKQALSSDLPKIAKIFMAYLKLNTIIQLNSN